MNRLTFLKVRFVSTRSLGGNYDTQCIQSKVLYAGSIKLI